MSELGRWGEPSDQVPSVVVASGGDGLGTFA